MRNWLDTHKLVSLIIDYCVIIAFGIFLGLIVGVIGGAYAGIWEALKKQEMNMQLIDKIQGYGITCGLILFSFFYYSHTFKKAGQTIGEKIMKIKIVPAYGERISLLSGIVRTLFLAPILAILGLFYATKDPKRTLLDYICLTKSVNVTEQKKK